MACLPDSFNDADAAKWKKLVSDGKLMAENGHFQKSIDLMKRALGLRWTEKLEKRIKKIEV